MDWQRSFLIGAMLVVLYMLFLEWDGFQAQYNPVTNSPALSELVVPEIPLVEPTNTPTPKPMAKY